VAPFWMLAAYAAGIALSAWLPAPQGPLVVIAAAVLALFWLLLMRRGLATVPLAVSLALLGLLWAHHCLEPPRHSDHISRRISQEAIPVEGVVRHAEQLWDGSARLDVEVARVDNAHARGLLRLTVRNGGPGAAPGDRISWLSRLRRPGLFGTPGEFNYPRYLAARGIYVTANIEQAADLARLVSASHPQAPLSTRYRHTVATAITRTLPADRSGLVQALTVGIGSGISPDQRQLLGAGGLSHLFAISGLHFGLLALLLYGASCWLYSRSERLLLTAPPRRILPLLLLLPLAGYLLLSGNATPTRRAYLMTALGALLFSCHRRTTPLALLASVALVMLIMSPLALFEASFQLSFAGVLGLMVWLPRWQSRLAGHPAWLRRVVLLPLTTLAATLATAPFALWHFHQVAPAGLVTNLLAIPLVAWGAVPAGLLGAALLPVAPTLAGIAFTLAGHLVAMTLKISAWLLTLPGLGAVPLFVTPREWCGVLLLGGAAMLPAERRRPAAALLILGSLLLTCPQLPGPRLQVTALSVGQGDATLLSYGSSCHYLVDGGSLAGTTVDVGERLIGPALGRLGVRRLAGVVLTHNHPDHSSGLAYLVDRFPVDGFWSAIPAAELEPRLATTLAHRKVPVHQLDEGWSQLDLRRPASLHLYVPPQDAEDLNDRSIVIHAAAGNDGVLLTGDLAVAGFEQLCAAGLPHPVTLLKLPHHGSRASRPDRFLDLLQPRLAFVSAGRDNPYRLPHPVSVAACSDRNIPLYRTDRQGTVTFSSYGRAWQVQCFKGVRD
jgi:competence protein ComEC